MNDFEFGQLYLLLMLANVGHFYFLDCLLKVCNIPTLFLFVICLLIIFILFHTLSPTLFIISYHLVIFISPLFLHQPHQNPLIFYYFYPIFPNEHGFSNFCLLQKNNFIFFHIQQTP